MTIYSDKDDRGLGIFRPMKEAYELIGSIINELLAKKQNKETCDAITKNTAFEETYKGFTERVLCEENPCLKKHKDRQIEDRCRDGEKRYICPLHDGFTKKLFIPQ